MILVFKIQFEMKRAVDSLSIKIRFGSDHKKNTFENTTELEIIVFTRTIKFDMKIYYLNNVG
jgi:hypothetical protein